MNANAQKITYYLVFALVAAGAALLVLDMWFGILSAGNLVKILITLVVTAALLCIFILIRRDVNEEERMKKDKYMD